MAKLKGAVSGGSPAPKGGGSIVSTTRNGSIMKTSKGDMADHKGQNIAKASTPTKAGPKSSGGSMGGMPSIKSTHAGTTNAGDAGAGLGGNRKLGSCYGN